MILKNLIHRKDISKTNIIYNVIYAPLMKKKKQNCKK